jgi:hypothetical protein
MIVPALIRKRLRPLAAARRNFLSILEMIDLHQKVVGLVKDRKVFILGSSPNATHNRFCSDSALICVNGSAANAIRLGLPAPSITIVDHELLDPLEYPKKEMRAAIIERRLLADLHLGALVSVQSNHSAGGSPDVLDAKFSNFTRISRTSRRNILTRASGIRVFDSSHLALVSNGSFAIALAAWLGSKEIFFSGFSIWQRGHKTHFYHDGANNDDQSPTFRNHSMADLSLVGLPSSTEFPRNEVDRHGVILSDQ